MNTYNWYNSSTNKAGQNVLLSKQFTRKEMQEIVACWNNENPSWNFWLSESGS
jgi:hypothetical protein